MKVWYNDIEFGTARSFLEWVLCDDDEWQETLNTIGDDVTVGGEVYGEGDVLRKMNYVRFHECRDEYIDSVFRTWTKGEVESMIIGDYQARIETSDDDEEFREGQR